MSPSSSKLFKWFSLSKGKGQTFQFSTQDYGIAPGQFPSLISHSFQMGIQGKVTLDPSTIGIQISFHFAHVTPPD